MKKTLFAIISLAVAATACNKADVIEMNKEAITFDKAFVDNSTKAIDPSYGADAVALTKFNVWGTVEGTNNGTQYVPVFANTLVTGTVNGGNWQTQNKNTYGRNFRKTCRLINKIYKMISNSKKGSEQSLPFCHSGVTQ